MLSTNFSGGVPVNSDFTKDSLNWRRLCRAAALEQDPNKIRQIVQRIDSALASRQQTLRRFAKTRRGDVSLSPSTLERAAA